MVIERIAIKNFRSVKDETLHCSDLTALVGRNGSGKSTFLRAMDLFYSNTPKIEPEDFYNQNTNEEIAIAITYKDLNQEALSLFEKYVQNNTLTVERVFTLKDGKTTSNYHGATLQNAQCTTVREAFNISDRLKTAKERYAALRSQPAFGDLSSDAKTKDAIEAALKEWESAHSGECVRSRDDGQFFGFKAVGSGYLGRFTKFLFIPAIRDASQDATDGVTSPIAELMNLVVRSVLASKPELSELKEKTQQQFSTLMNPSNLTELTDLAGGMTRTLQNFVPDTSIEMSWQRLANIDFPLPKADTKLNQDGYASPVSRAGHGLQRAFIITALQHLVLAQQNATASGSTTVPLPVLVLAIEEPELYQHPNSQHHLAKIILQIANGKTPGVAEKTQVIYCTHSPYFVGIDRIDQIRLLRKKSLNSADPKVTSVIQTNLEQVAEKVWEINGALGDKYTGTTLIPRLVSIMTPSMNEGFFADVAVLVEGEGDVSAILGTAEMLGHDFASMGISVIACNGKNSIDRPAVIFSKLGISTYIVWDSDKGAKDSKKEDNYALQRLLGISPLEDFPETKVGSQYACFEVKLEDTLKKEIGDNFEKYLIDAQGDFDIPKRAHAIKNPFIISQILKVAKQNSEKSTTLESIVENIVALRNASR